MIAVVWTAGVSSDRCGSDVFTVAKETGVAVVERLHKSVRFEFEC